MHSCKDLNLKKLKIVSEKNVQTKHSKCNTKTCDIIKHTIAMHVFLIRTFWGTKFTYKIHASQK